MDKDRAAHSFATEDAACADHVVMALVKLYAGLLYVYFLLKPQEGSSSTEGGPLTDSDHVTVGREAPTQLTDTG